MEHGWGEKSYCPSPEKSASQVCKVGRGLAFLHGVLHFLAVVVYILHRKVNDIPEFLQVFLHILHFCQIRRTSPGCCRSASVWLGDAAELGRMRCRSDAGGQGVPRLGSRPEHGEAANTFPSPLPISSVGLHGLLFAGAWLRVAGLVGLVWYGFIV